MDRREAKRYACRMVAREITAQGEAEWRSSNWETGEEFSDEDAERIEAACEDIAEELAKRGGIDEISTVNEEGTSS